MLYLNTRTNNRTQVSFILFLSSINKYIRCKIFRRWTYLRPLRHNPEPHYCSCICLPSGLCIPRLLPLELFGIERHLFPKEGELGAWRLLQWCADSNCLSGLPEDLAQPNTANLQWTVWEQQGLVLVQTSKKASGEIKREWKAQCTGKGNASHYKLVTLRHSAENVFIDITRNDTDKFKRTVYLSDLNAFKVSEQHMYPHPFFSQQLPISSIIGNPMSKGMVWSQSDQPYYICLYRRSVQEESKDFKCCDVVKVLLKANLLSAGCDEERLRSCRSWDRWVIGGSGICSSEIGQFGQGLWSQILYPWIQKIPAQRTCTVLKLLRLSRNFG